MKHNKPKLTTIYIVRHAQTEWNVKRLMQGHADSPLTSLGETQAKQLAQELSHIHFDGVFSSDLLRAKRTAKIIVAERRVAVKTTTLLREQHFGRFEGKPYEEFNNAFRNLLQQYDQASDQDKFGIKLEKGIETDGEAVMRFITHLRELAIGFRGKTILVVCHGSIMRYFLIRLGFGTFTSLPINAVTHTACIKVESDGVDFFIKETKGIQKLEDLEE